MKLFDINNPVFRVLKYFIMGYTREEKSYYYLHEPMYPRFLTRQEVLVFYQFHLEQVKVMLLAVLSCYNTYGTVEEYLALTKKYTEYVKRLKQCYGSPYFYDIPKLQFEKYDSLFENIEQKKNLWSMFSKQIADIQQVIKIRLSSEIYPVLYSPKYPEKEEKFIKQLLVTFKNDYKPLPIATKQLTHNILNIEPLPTGYSFVSENPRMFYTPDGKTISFVSAKQHPYKVFKILFEHNGVWLTTTSLKRVMRTGNLADVISKLNNKIKPFGIQIINDRQKHYALTSIQNTSDSISK